METNRTTSQNNVDGIQCHVCNKKLDYLTASVSRERKDSIYMCFGAILQKIFVYGKYIGGKYGSISFAKYYTKEECSQKVCENNIKDMLAALNQNEYSRLITCNRGMMNCILLTKPMIDIRMKVLIDGLLKEILHDLDGKKKYYCYEHAKKAKFKCSCGEELLKIGSEKYRDVTGMEDQKFMEKFLPEILYINPYDDTRKENCK